MRYSFQAPAHQSNETAAPKQLYSLSRRWYRDGIIQADEEPRVDWHQNHNTAWHRYEAISAARCTWVVWKNVKPSESPHLHELKRKTTRYGNKLPETKQRTNGTPRKILSRRSTKGSRLCSFTPKNAFGKFPGGCLCLIFRFFLWFFSSSEIGHSA